MEHFDLKTATFLVLFITLILQMITHFSGKRK